MGIADRKMREKEAVRALILKSSRKIVRQEGWESLSIRRIADAIEYSVPVIYSHFANKEAIMLEFAKEGFQKLNQALQRARVKYAEPEEQIEALAYAYLHFAVTHKEYYRLMYGLGIPGCKTVRETAELSAFTEILLDPIRKIIAKSKNKNTDAIAKMQVLWSMLHGLVSIDSMDDENREALNKAVLNDFVCNFIAGMKK